MKKCILYILFLMVSISVVNAQSELPSDSLIKINSSKVKKFGEFLLDMRLMNAANLKLPKFNFEFAPLAKDYNQFFALPSNEVYSLESITSSSMNSAFGFSAYGFTESLQKATFKLNNGWSLNAFGNYNASGWKMPNQSAFPWEKNNFRGGFELKSNNNTFGIRLEVRQGREYPY